jgi:uncharacterized protein YegL
MIAVNNELNGIFYETLLPTDEIATELVEELIKQKVVSRNFFDLPDNLSDSGNALQFPIIFLTDTSASLSNHLNDLNTAKRSFIESILDDGNGIQASMDVCEITFSSIIVLKKAFGYLNMKSAAECKLSQSEIGGNTSLASALFCAWYLGVSRKMQYKANGLKYRQPIIILLSDMQNNENGTFKSLDIAEFTANLINAQQANHKLALIKALYGTISKAYNRIFEGKEIQCEEFIKDLTYFFNTLLATVADEGGTMKPIEDPPIKTPDKEPGDDGPLKSSQPSSSPQAPPQEEDIAAWLRTFLSKEE